MLFSSCEWSKQSIEYYRSVDQTKRTRNLFFRNDVFCLWLKPQLITTITSKIMRSIDLFSISLQVPLTNVFFLPLRNCYSYHIIVTLVFSSLVFIKYNQCNNEEFAKSCYAIFMRHLRFSWPFIKNEKGKNAIFNQIVKVCFHIEARSICYQSTTHRIADTEIMIISYASFIEKIIKNINKNKKSDEMNFVFGGKKGYECVQCWMREIKLKQSFKQRKRTEWENRKIRSLTNQIAIHIK